MIIGNNSFYTVKFYLFIYTGWKSKYNISKDGGGSVRTVHETLERNPKKNSKKKGINETIKFAEKLRLHYDITVALSSLLKLLIHVASRILCGREFQALRSLVMGE